MAEPTTTGPGLGTTSRTTSGMASAAVPDTRPGPVVRVETVELEPGGARQIARRSRTTSSLADRSDEISAAIVQASEIAQGSLAQVPEEGGWRVSSLEVTFGLTLAAEAGVILSKASAEASFEVTLTLERQPTSEAAAPPSAPPSVPPSVPPARTEGVPSTP
ncbi:CU044_2847 family protein [Streptomyces vilmorinianum]|uniref:CU044_2847 family protein n=1 Tax=Streptomyces vilmorinianum TaxID=3051092 RepID=UPI0020C7C6FF|nr:CU044_2847 family protein [Streptomyces vilmorinianum]